MCHQHYHNLGGLLQHNIYQPVVFCHHLFEAQLLKISYHYTFPVFFHSFLSLDHFEPFDSTIIFHTHQIFVSDKTSGVHCINSFVTAWRMITNRRLRIETWCITITSILMRYKWKKLNIKLFQIIVMLLLPILTFSLYCKPLLLLGRPLIIA